MDEAIQYVLLKAHIVICNIISIPNLQRILAVSQNNMEELLLIRNNMTALEPTHTQPVAIFTV